MSVINNNGGMNQASQAYMKHIPGKSEKAESSGNQSSSFSDPVDVFKQDDNKNPGLISLSEYVKRFKQGAGQVAQNPPKTMC